MSPILNYSRIWNEFSINTFNRLLIMDTFWIWVLPTIGGFLLYVLINAGVRQSGLSLQKKFVELGTLKGRSLKEITDKCGSPSSYSTSIGADGKSVKVVQWLETGYHIVLLFDEKDICLGVSSEISV